MIARIEHLRELVRNPPSPINEQERNDYFVIGARVMDRIAADIAVPVVDQEVIVARELFGNNDMVVSGLFARMFEMLPGMAERIQRGLR